MSIITKIEDALGLSPAAPQACPAAPLPPAPEPAKATFAGTSPLSTTKPIVPVSGAARKATDHIVLHVEATPLGKDFTSAQIDRMHRQQGWQCIGYHYTIRLDGTIEAGRPEDMVGAHVLHFNSRTIGISVVGGLDKDGKPADTRTPAQLKAQIALIKDILTRHPQATVVGHRDFPDQNRACPCFDAIPWAKALGLPAGFGVGQPSNS